MMKLETWKRSRFFYPTILILIWAAICAIIGYYGNFPLGDDWAYGRPVLEMLNTGKVHITDWSSMTLVGQIWYGALVTKIFGFSFDILRLSTLFLAMSAILASYGIILRLTKNPFYGFAGASLFMFAPHFIRNSFCFSTDVPFLGFVLWGIYFLLRFLEDERPIQYIVGIAFVAYAFLIRDVAIVVPPAFAIAYALKHKFRLNKFPAALIINVLIAAEYFLYRYWLTHIHGMTGSMDFSKNVLLDVWTSGPVYFAKRYGKNLFYAVSFFGSCLFPITLAMIGKFLKSSGKVFRISFFATASLGSLAIVLVIVKNGASAVFFREFLYDLIFRHFILDSVHQTATNLIWTPWTALIVVLSLLAFNGGLALVWISAKFIETSFKDKTAFPSNGLIFVVAIFVIYLTIIFSQNLFNRYLMIMLPLVIGALLYVNKSSIKDNLISAPVFIMMAVIGYFSIVLTRDLMEYERALWQGLNFLTIDKGISPKQIDGGFEFNAWHLYDYKYKKKPGKNWWWVDDDKYAVAYGSIPGYKTIKSIDYGLWLPPGYKAKILVLERIE